MRKLCLSCKSNYVYTKPIITSKCIIPECTHKIEVQISHFCQYHWPNHYYDDTPQDDFSRVTKLFILENGNNILSSTYDKYIENILPKLCITQLKYNSGQIYPRDVVNVFVLQTSTNNLYIITSSNNNRPGSTFSRNIYKCIKVTKNIYRFDMIDFYTWIDDSSFLIHDRSQTYFNIIPTDIIRIINRYVF